MLRELWTRSAHAVLVAAVTFSSAATALASGVGASIYVPAKARPVVQQASYATAVPGHPVPVPSDSQLQGMATMKRLGVTPCDVEGACSPTRASFGYNQPRWRRWPGTETESPRPRRAAEQEDDLVPAIVPPAPEEEDKQAPPPIDEVEEDRPDSPLSDEVFQPAIDAPGGGLELDLPPLPERPLPRPALPGAQPPRAEPPAGFQPPPRQDGPPGLPFGWRPAGPASPAAVQQLPGAENAPPAAPFFARPNPLPKPEADDAPPALPEGFTALQQPGKLLRRLPRLLSGSREPRRRDPSVVPVAAFAPTR